MQAIEKFRKSFPNVQFLDPVNITDFHGNPEELKKKVESLSPTHVVLAFCDADHSSGDVKRVFLE